MSLLGEVQIIPEIDGCNILKRRANNKKSHPSALKIKL